MILLYNIHQDKIQGLMSKAFRLPQFFITFLYEKMVT